MRLKLTATVIALTASLGVMAQQDPYYTHFMYNQMSFNPAFAGFKSGYICATAVHHQQWLSWTDENPYPQPTGEKTAPVTTNINIAGRLDLSNKPASHPLNSLGAGINIYQDKFGFYNMLAPQLALSYQFKLGGNPKQNKLPNHWIGIGLSAGMLQSSLDGTKLTPQTVGDPLIPALSSGSAFDLGAGAYYHNPRFKKLTVGISATHLTAPVISYTGGGVFPVARHYYVYAGLEQPIGGNGLVLKPSVLFKQNTKLQMDANATIEFRQKYWAGISYRSGDNTNLMIGLVLFERANQVMKMGYSFDFTLTQVRKFSYGTHELMLSYCFKLPTKSSTKEPYIKRDVRWL